MFQSLKPLFLRFLTDKISTIETCYINFIRDAFENEIRDIFANGWRGSQQNLKLFKVFKWDKEGRVRGPNGQGGGVKTSLTKTEVYFHSSVS